MAMTHHRGAACTYDSLRDSDVVGRGGVGWLVWSASVAQDGQLLGALDAALAEASQLNPVCADRLISCDYEIVAFACG